MDKQLSVLFALQHVDLQLQEIQEVKGDLPSAVAELQSKVDDTTNKIQELNNRLKQLKIRRDATDVEMIDVTEKIEKYKAQQLQVKSNKQYDALTKEIESSEIFIRKAETDIQDDEGAMQVVKQDLESLTTNLQQYSSEFEEKRGELSEVNKEHEIEESRLLNERKKLVVLIPKDELERYERIRKAKGGTAVVPVKRSACGGCYKSIPRQKILEIRQTSKFYMCEHCGRIIVSDEVVSLSSAVL